MIPALGLRALFVLGAVAFLVGAGWYARGVVAERDEAALLAKLATEREQTIAAALAETNRRLAEQKEITDEADQRAAAARRDAAAASGAADRLRRRALELASAAAACDSAPSSPSPAASAPGMVLANMLQRLEERGREAAAALDAAYAAGVTCERIHESLTDRRAP